MRASLLAVALSVTVAAPLACCGQSQWKHELVLRFSGQYTGRVSGPASFPDHAVSPRGVPVYTISLGTFQPEAYQYTTNLNLKYYGPLSYGRTGATNASSQAGFVAIDATNVHVNVDGHDFYEEVLPPNLNALVDIKSVDDLGRPFWFYGYPGHEHDRVFRGNEELSTSATGMARLISSNRRGDCVWDQFSTENGVTQHDIMLNHTNFSAPILGSNRNVLWGRVNELGDLLWVGLGSNTARKPQLYLNETNLGQQLGIPSAASMEPLALNSRGDALWQYKTSVTADWHLMLNGTDISAAVYGDLTHSVYAEDSILGEDGTVAWSGYTTGHPTQVFRNEEDLSSVTIGADTGRTIQLVAMDKMDNVLWDGGGSATESMQDVFVNRLDLTMDYFKDNSLYHQSSSLAMGENGQVLWTAETADGMQNIYLSTPVPEPSTSLFSLSVVALLVRRRRS